MSYPPAPFTRLACSVCLLALLFGCAGDGVDPRVRAAEQALRDTMQVDPNYARYALAVAGRASSPTTEQLIVEQLAAADFELAGDAIDAATQRPSPALSAALQPVFETTMGAGKLQAAGALALGGDAAALQWLRDNVRDASGAPIMGAVRFLLAAGEEQLAQEVLTEALESEDRGQRDAVYGLLAEAEGEWAADLASSGLKDEFGEERSAAIVALGQVGGPEHAAKIQRFLNTRGLVFVTIEALGNLGNEDAAPGLHLMLARPEPQVQVYAVAALDKLGMEKDTKAALDGLMVAEDPAVRVALAEQLAGVQRERAASVLASLAGDADPKVRAAAVRGLAARADASLETVFLDRLADEEYEVVTLALEALARFAGPESVAAIEPLLASENGYVTIAAASAILDILARSTPVAG